MDCAIHGCARQYGTRCFGLAYHCPQKTILVRLRERAHDPSLWDSPLFIRTNVVITSVWATVFTVNVILAWGKMKHFVLPEIGYELASYTFLIGAAAFTNWYTFYVRHRREVEAREPANMQ